MGSAVTNEATTARMTVIGQLLFANCPTRRRGRMATLCLSLAIHAFSSCGRNNGLRTRVGTFRNHRGRENILWTFCVGATYSREKTVSREHVTVRESMSRFHRRRSRAIYVLRIECVVLQKACSTFSSTYGEHVVSLVCTFSSTYVLSCYGRNKGLRWSGSDS